MLNLLIPDGNLELSDKGGGKTETDSTVKVTWKGSVRIPLYMSLFQRWKHNKSNTTVLGDEPFRVEYLGG